MCHSQTTIRECRKKAALTNTNNAMAVEEPKEAEKPPLVLSIGSEAYPVFFSSAQKAAPVLKNASGI